MTGVILGAEVGGSGLGRRFRPRRPTVLTSHLSIVVHSTVVIRRSIYPALIRLEQQEWIKTQWGVSETNRKVKSYSLTAAGTRQLRIEVANWERATALVARFLEAKP